nr:hypothetical protein [Bacillus thuringiensis]
MGKRKGPGLSRPRTKPENPEAKIKRLEAENEMLEKEYMITLLCAVAGVTRSGYYKWIKRHAVPFKKQLADPEFKKKILECHTKPRGIYGYKKIQV